LNHYSAEKKFKFVRLIFNTDKAFNSCKWMFSEKNQKEKPIKVPGIDNIPFYIAFDTNIKHVNRFCHILNIETTGWVTIKKYKENLEYSSVQINITVNWSNIEYDNNTKSVAPMTIFSWDIECLPENTEEFPNPDVKGDVIKQISTVLLKYGSSVKQKFIFTSSECSEIKYCKICETGTHVYDQEKCTGIIRACSKTCKKNCENCKKVCESTEWEDAIVIESKNEKELLKNFCEFIGIVDPDILTGYSTWTFDDMYFWKRAQLHHVDITKLSRINQLDSRLVKKELSSAAYGNNEFNYIMCPGRETFDMIVAIRREHKLESFSLNFTSNHFLKKSKIDLKYSILFQKLNGNRTSVAECAIYCIGDSMRTIELFIKLNMLPNYVEMAKATYVPMEWLLFRGQQCKVFSLIAKEARTNGFVIPVYEQTGPGKKYKGATVIEPMTGMYFDPIAGLDFASLYPSIMVAYNMCYSTIISPDMMDYVIKNNIPYKTIEWESCSNFECKATECKHTKEKFSNSFVQAEDGNGNIYPNGIRGILPTILMRLLQGRKDTKKLMKAEKDPFMYAVLNGKQLAQKVTTNSVYGFTGAEKGILPEKRIAASVTAKGRMMIDKTSKLAAAEYGALTVYGDSIPGYETISVVKKDPTHSGLYHHLNVREMHIEEFSEGIRDDWQEYRGFKIGDTTICNKEFKDLSKKEFYTKTHMGFQKINKVIKHQTTIGVL
jgi:DNA polymerase delta subunit 1